MSYSPIEIFVPVHPARDAFEHPCLDRILQQLPVLDCITVPFLDSIEWRLTFHEVEPATRPALKNELDALSSDRLLCVRAHPAGNASLAAHLSKHYESGYDSFAHIFSVDIWNALAALFVLANIAEPGSVQWGAGIVVVDNEIIGDFPDYRAIASKPERNRSCRGAA